MITSIKKHLAEVPYNINLAAPVILGMLGHTLVAFADNIMVGRLGPAQLAAVSLGNSFLFIAMSVGLGLSTAITPLIAEADGFKKQFEIKKVFKHGVLICAVVGLVLTGVVFLSVPLLYQMQQPEEVLVFAVPFLTIVGVSLIPLMLFQAIKQLCDGLSRTRLPMYASIIGNLLNVLLNYVLIFGNFGFPEMGVAGAALGTLISRIVMLLLLIVFLKGSTFFAPLLSELRWSVVSWRFSRRILALGLPSSFQVFFEVTLFTSAIWLSGILGTLHQAANQIALNLASMTYMVGIGLNVAAMIRVGNQRGKRDYKRLNEVAQSIFFLTLVIELVFALGFLAAREVLPALYLDANDPLNRTDNLFVMGLASDLLLWAAIFQVFDGLQVVIIGALRGMQDVNFTAYITFVAYWIIGFPVSYYLGLHTSLATQGIWIGLTLGLTVSALLLYLRFQYLSKTHRIHYVTS
ncbi:MAG: MATE family efflux transporter [Flavobacteriaceae bacterium]